jgi:hypothetical protein
MKVLLTFLPIYGAALPELTEERLWVSYRDLRTLSLWTAEQYALLNPSSSYRTAPSARINSTAYCSSSGITAPFLLLLPLILLKD